MTTPTYEISYRVNVANTKFHYATKAQALTGIAILKGPNGVLNYPHLKLYECISTVIDNEETITETLIQEGA